MDDGSMPGPDERFERIPWEQLMADATGGDRRRWMVGAGAAVAVVGIVAFLLGSGGATAPDAAPAAPAPAASTVPAPPPTEPLPVLASEADLMAPPPVADDAVVPALEAYLTAAFSSPTTAVEHVRVEPEGGADFRATLTIVEVGPTGRRPLEPIGLSLRAVASPTGLTLERLAPERSMQVVVPAATDEVADLTDPVRDALVVALEPWPGALVEAVGNDAGRWWARVGIPLPSGGHLPVTVWPDLVVGLGAGG